MKHRFLKVDYDAENISEKLQECLNCGHPALFRKGKNITYIHKSGGRHPTPEYPCGVLSDKTEASVIPISMIIPEKKMNAEESAKTFDALLLIRILYEDLVKNGINSTARQMAGRFLYSSGYQELVKSIEK